MSTDIVKVEEGVLRGKVQETLNGVQYRSFQGIPYAKPPVNELRFKDPQPADKWNGVRDATVEGNACPQVNEQTGEVVGNEDCLVLSVYTPQMSSDEDTKLPVMVWIHGGGFYKGSNNYTLYGPDYLIEHNVICVNVNYRFGIFGFLCLHSNDVPGNAGLKDLILALKWINKNISQFGGDHNNITVFGESAGAASISYLSLSAAAEGLFERMIIQSGTSLCPWAIQKDPLKYAKKISNELGLEKNKDILKFLQTVPFKELTQQAFKTLEIEEVRRFMPIAFLPVVEKSFAGVQPILTEHPHKIFMSDNFMRIPTIAGFSSKEGLLLFEQINFEFEKCHTLVTDLRNVLPVNLNSDKLVGWKDALDENYFGRKPIDMSQLQGVIDLISDVLFRHPINWNVILHAKHSSIPIYYFQFSYQGNLSRDKKFFRELKMEGASHSEECGYIFKKQRNENDTPLDEDILTRKRLTTMWTNFAKFGNPTPEINDVIPVLWEPATENKVSYLEINKDLKVCTDPNSTSLQLWMKIQDSCDIDLL